MTKTTNLQLNKPDADDFYDIDVHNANMDVIDEEITSTKAEVVDLKKSVSDGKKLVADAITGKGVATATDAAFATMATNISNIKTGVDVSDTTASATDILAGKTAGLASGIITGTMVNNGAVNQSLGINGTYTIPAGYHNGSGKVIQSITTKAAATFTPGDTVQTIAAEQYLSGVQTISAVPTETKTVTAGTSATTVNRTSGKYMTAVTVNPTPSQTKNVTLTSSPLTVTPDAGYLLSSVTVSGELRKFASGTISGVYSEQKMDFLVFKDSYYHTNYSATYCTVECSFVPQILFYVTKITGSASQTIDETIGVVSNLGVYSYSGYTYNGHYGDSRNDYIQYQTTLGTSTNIALYGLYPNSYDVTWYAFG